MPRRASSSVHPAWFILCAVLLIAAIVGGTLIFGALRDPYRTLTPLDVSAYLENSNSLRGNTYKLDATIDSKLAWSAAEGSLYSVNVSGKDGDQPLPLMVPSSFNSLNVQKGQRFYIQVEVGDQGVLIARDFKKA
ncbi:MAG: hypothetical protein QM796_18930 [Chthoniobacteraceae bacterium]